MKGEAKMQNKVKDYIESIQGDIKEVLLKNGAIIIDSHLVLTSGKHSPGYIDLRKLAGKSTDIGKIGAMLGETIQRQVGNADYYCDEGFLLVGPETMGRSLAHETACLITDKSVRTNHVWCEQNADKTAMCWNPKIDFADIVAEQHCIIVDDVLTTAKTLMQTINLIRNSGGIVEGAVVVIRRDSTITAEIVDIPWLIALYEVDLQSYDSDNCPLCAKQIPMLLHPGHGHEWIKDHSGYPTA